MKVIILQQKLDSLLSDYDKGLLSRSQLLAALAAVAVSPAIGSPASFQARSLNHVSLSVSDIERSQAFYERVLGVGVVSIQKNGINIALGNSFLGLNIIDDRRSIHHFCVGLDQYNVNEAADKLRELGIDTYLREDKAEVYFQDPDGITVQFENKKYRGSVIHAQGPL